MDRQWMYADRRSKEFIDGMHYFLRVAEANRQRGFICCPCNKCKNQKEYSASRTIHFHLFESGFMPSYNCWTSHGEQGVEMEEDEVEDDNIPDFAQYVGFEGNQTGEEEIAADGNDVADDLGQMLQDAKEDYESEKEAHKLDKMLEDHRTSLYPGCEQGHKKLDTTLEFLQWKAKNGVSDKAFGNLLKLVKNILPEGNKLPETTYEAKKIVCPLGLEVQKIHACPNDCILYRGEEYENLEACPVCKALRYKIRRDDPGEVDGQLTKKRIPAKVMWYFPIIPRVRRLFRNKGNARMMRWHAEERQQDGMLRHPADSSQWRNIDRKFKEFGKDARNIRFGLSTDGMNPFGEMSSGHSTWPVTICIYNLPPGYARRGSPKQPDNDIDVYLRPLVEDLKLLWKNEGVPVWDEDKQEEFNLRALPFVTINDWPALSNLSGQSNKGYKACTHCMDETESTYLKHYRKVVYMGHRRFLAANHSVRKKGKHFEHKADHRVYGKLKDTLEARNDLKHMEQRGDLHPEPKEKGSHYLSPASYTLSKAEKESMFECLESIKVPSGYSMNIKRIISTKEKKFTNLKSHDCHVLMTQLLLVVIRGILPDNVRATITKLCAFMNAISQKVIDPERLEALQNEVVQCLVSFELIFPPSFFNIMTHLLCHLVKEISILGPVYLHNMFPFERYMGVLKKYVRNRARPEASIAKCYGTEEVIEFCVEFIEDLRPIGIPESRHEGRLRGKGTLGRKAIMMVDNNLFRKAHFTVLQHSSLVAPYIEEHLALVRARNIGKSDAWITRHHIDTFPAWLRQHLMGNESINQQLAFLARGPSGSIATFQGYEINEYTFYTRAQDMKSTNQNSVVHVDAMGHDGTTATYYGAIEDIWELDYGPLKDMSSKGKKGRGPDEPKRHVVLPGKRKIVGVEDKTDEDYDQLDGQPPFTVTIDPSILLSNEDTPYSRSDHKEGTIVRRKAGQTAGGLMGDYTADYTGIGYMQNRADGMTGRDTGLTASMAGQTVPTMAGQTVYYAGQTVPTIAGQTVPYHGQIAPPVAGLTAPLTTGQTGPWAGYPPDTRQGQYNHIALQQPPLRPPNTPPDPHRPKNMEELLSDIIRATFGVEAKDRARENQKPYPDFYDAVPYPPNYKIPEFTKFSGEDNRTTYEHVDQFLAQCGRASSMDTYNDGIAEPSGGSDCVDSLENSIIEDIAELDDGSDCITSESEIALSPKTESQIGHVDVGKDNNNVLRDSTEIGSKVAMHTYQRPYPEHVDSVPYPQGFEVPNFTKFTGEDARITMEHIGQFIDQCDHFPQKNRSGGSKVKKVKKVWVRKEVKAPEVVAINEESQDVHVPTGDAAKTIQAEKTKADAIAVDIGCLTEPACRSNRQTTAAPTAVLNPIIKLWPFRGWALDFIGQIYPSSSKEHWFVLVAMDYFTKWAEAVPLENITCTEIPSFPESPFSRKKSLKSSKASKATPGLEWYIPGLEIELCSRGGCSEWLGLYNRMPCYKPEYLFGVEGFVQELRTMSFVIGFGNAPFYAQIRHDRHEEKCRVKVTLNSNSEDIPSVMFEAGGRNYIHACQEVARIAIGELRDRYSDQLVDTEYRYHPRQPQGSDRGSYLETEGIENDVTTRHLVEMLWAMDESRAETVLAAQDREDRNRGKICKLEDKVDRLEKELAALKGEAPPQKARIRLTARKRALFVPRYQLAPKVRVVEKEVAPANPPVIIISSDEEEEPKRNNSKFEWVAIKDEEDEPNEPSIDLLCSEELE
uniref:Transposon protein, putative, CACTA, En/Spm sub-class n=2 Tax=Oryza sativa subsp. japonica TaxID=39947 RepID=Q109Z8_ORYSJ|nr:transposon protein, putative, CACTA, En/Spm sub-class [Oryza sativa Japonica Group]